jgi:hypothetical protein
MNEAAALALNAQLLELRSLVPPLRGLRFEDFLSQLLDVCNLAPRVSFRSASEQIDGNLRLHFEVYLWPPTLI